MRLTCLAGIAGAMAVIAAGCGGGAGASRPSGAVANIDSSYSYEYHRIKRIDIGETYPQRAWREVSSFDPATSPYRRMNAAEMWEVPKVVAVERVQPRSRARAETEARPQEGKPVDTTGEEASAEEAADADAAEDDDVEAAVEPARAEEPSAESPAARRRRR